jgi:uncharacterized delta-60 repeat protein
MTGLDLTFDGDGRAITDLGSNSDRVNSLISVANGKILAVGSANGSTTILVRYNADGSLDNSFGVAGKLNTPLTNTPPILVTTDGKIIIAGTGPDGKSYVFRLLANGQIDNSFGTNGLYSTGSTDRIKGLSSRINPIDNSNEIIINQSADSALYYLQKSTLLDVNGKIKPFPIGSNTVATSLVLDQNVLNGILSSTTIDKTNPQVQNILNILGEPLINQLRSKFTKIDYDIYVIGLKDGSTAVSFTGTSSSSQYISSIAHFSADGKSDPNFGSSGLMIPPFPPSYQGTSSVTFDKKDGLNIAIYDNITKEISVYRYTKNGQLDSTFGNNGKVNLPGTIDGAITYNFKLSIVVDSQNSVLITTGNTDNNVVDVFRFSSNGSIDTTFGTNGKLQLSGKPGDAVLLGADNRLFLGSDINGDIVVSKYDIGGTTIAATHTHNDFNGDIKSDILWQNTDGSIAQWQMNGSTVTPSSVGALTSDWKIAGTGDFNGDRKADILFANTNGTVATWQMDGSTVTQTSTIGSITSDWKIAGTGDFNGDRKADILFQNTNGTIATWQMDGSIVTKSSIIGANTTDWKIAGTGDFNGDGNTDILFQNTNGTIALWQMNGSTVTSTSVIGTTTSDWKIAGVGDFNGDGKADILWRNTNGSVAEWQMSGSTVASTSVIGSATTDWKIAGTGDYNGDGNADILWRNDLGTVATWQLSGSTVLSASLTSIPSAATGWNIATAIG